MERTNDQDLCRFSRPVPKTKSIGESRDEEEKGDELSKDEESEEEDEEAITK